MVRLRLSDAFDVHVDITRSSWPISEEVAARVKDMSLQEKVGQMLQLDIGTILLGGNSVAVNQTQLDYFVEKYFVGSFLNSPTSMGPVGNTVNLSPQDWINVITQIQNTSITKGNKIPMIYGLDSVHGANYIQGSTIFPHQIMAAATFNRSLVQNMGAITAKDTRAVGIPWTFSPILGIATQPLWARVYETFGEDPYLASEMGVAIINGYQVSLALRQYLCLRESSDRCCIYRYRSFVSGLACQLVIAC